MSTSIWCTGCRVKRHLRFLTGRRMLGWLKTSPRRGSGLYEAFGGAAECRRLADAFYARVENDPLLRPLFPGTTLRCAIDEFSAFLAQFLEQTRRGCKAPLVAELSRVAPALQDRTSGEREAGIAAADDRTSAVDNATGSEILRRWDAQRLVDEVVAAIRIGNAERAIALGETPELQAYGDPHTPACLH